MTAPKPSCLNCAFRLDEVDQTWHLRQTIGTSACGAGHGPTGVPTASASQNEKISEIMASSCGSYVHESSAPDRPMVRSVSGAIVMLPDPVVLERTVLLPNTSPVQTCLQCRNFIAPNVSMEHGLWNVGICAARGVLIQNTDVANMAVNCEARAMGPRDPESITRMQLMPAFSAGMNIGTVPVAGIVMEEVTEVIEPTEHETDQPVSEADALRGIRAWRKINDPESGNFVFLPIYDLNFFSATERETVPRTDDDEHPEQYIDHQGLVYKCAVLWLHLNETPALWGVAGTGKSEFYRHMAWLMVAPFNRISVTASTEVEDLAGKMHFEPTRGTYFEYGRIPRAWSKPGIICLDEPNVGPPDVWQFIRPLTDNSKQLVLDMNNGERVSRHPDAYLGLAMNPAWDVRNVGTGMLADADGSRLMHIYVDLPSAEIERKIIKARCKLDAFDISEEQIDAIMGIATELRLLCADDTLPITWGIRPQIKVARALRWFGMPSAYRLATADYLEPEQQQIILDVVKAHTVATPKKKFAAPPKPYMEGRPTSTSIPPLRSGGPIARASSFATPPATYASPDVPF